MRLLPSWILQVKKKEIPKFQGVSDDKSAWKRVANGLTHVHLNYIALPGSLEGTI